MRTGFWQARKANMSIAVAFSTIPLLGVFGLSIDGAMAAASKAATQRALDTAVIAGAKYNFINSDPDTALRLVQEVFNKNIRLANCDNEIDLQPDPSTYSFAASIVCHYTPILMPVIGINRQFTWEVSSKATYFFAPNVEMILLVDMSYRMCGDFGQQYESSLSVVNQEWPKCEYILDRSVLVGSDPIADDFNCLRPPTPTCSFLPPGQRIWWDLEASQIAWNDPISGSVMTARHIMTNIAVGAVSEPVSMEVLNEIATVDETGTKAEQAKNEIRDFIDQVPSLITKYKFDSFKIGLIPAQKGVNIGLNLYSVATGETSIEEITYVMPKYTASNQYDPDCINTRFVEINYTDAPPGPPCYYQGGEFSHGSEFVPGIRQDNEILPLTDMKTNRSRLVEAVEKMRPVQLSGRVYSGRKTYPASADMVTGMLWARNLLSSGWAPLLGASAPQESSDEVKKIIVIISEGYTNKIFPVDRGTTIIASDMCEFVASDENGYDIYGIGYQVYDYGGHALIPYGKELNDCVNLPGESISEKSTRLYGVAPDDTSTGKLVEILKQIVEKQANLSLVSG